MQDAPKVFLVDDDPSVLRGLTRVLTVAGYSVEQFVSPLSALERVTYNRPACFLVDLRMPEMSGLEFQEAALGAGSIIPVVFLSGVGDIPSSVKALQRGALDFLVKPIPAEQLLAAVAGAIERHRKEIAERRQLEEAGERFRRLSPREREVASLVACGLLNKQISFELGVAERTVKLHRARVMTKLGLNSVPELVRLIERLQVITKVTK